MTAFKRGLWRHALAVPLALGLTATAAMAAEDSFPVELVIDGKKQDYTWQMVKKEDITKPWKLCVLFPHLKDSYWVAADYGVVKEAERANVAMQLYEAGGYTNLSTQLNQMDNCIAQKFDAIILGAISADGVGALVKKATDAGIPVIDFVNGVNAPSTSGHALVSFYDLAYTTGKYLVEKHGNEKLVVGFFPGPQGAGWSDDAVKGFNDAIAGSNIKIAVTRRGDTGMNVQLDLIQNALQAYPDINYLVGVDIAAQAAAVAVRNAGQQGNIKVAAFDIIPPVYEDIAHGATEASPTDFTVLQGRLAVDMALRLLEKQELPAKRAGPKPVMVTADNYDKIPQEDMFAPKSFQVQFTVTPK
jgi:protein TorT